MCAAERRAEKRVSTDDEAIHERCRYVVSHSSLLRTPERVHIVSDLAARLLENPSPTPRLPIVSLSSTPALDLLDTTPTCSHRPRLLCTLSALPGLPIETPGPLARRHGHSRAQVLGPLDCRSRIRPRPLRSTCPLLPATHIHPHSSPRHAHPLVHLISSVFYPRTSTIDCPRISLENEERLQQRDKLGRGRVRGNEDIYNTNLLSKSVRRHLSQSTTS